MRSQLCLAMCACAVLLTACRANNSDPDCTCAADEKYNGADCVATADFVAPTDCVDDGSPVCGCDASGYTSECAATQQGVQVANVGACASAAGGGSSGGW